MYSISPREEIFWDHADAATEMSRIFDVCHGCRLCDNLCPSFTDLFDRLDVIDDEYMEAGRVQENPSEKLTEGDFDHVTDVCYQCKLCYVKCPYTPPHQYQLDFPRLLLRWQAIRAKERGGHVLQNLALGHTEWLGTVGSAVPGLMNWANRNPLARAAMEFTVGIDRRKLLPEYHGETFANWFAHRTPKATPLNSNPEKVGLFFTCTVNYNAPYVGKACVEVLEHNGVEVIVPEQVCCGMPQLGTADYPATQRAVNTNVDLMKKYVEEGYTIVTPGPSCGYMIRQEYPHFADDVQGAETLAAATMDICEYLMSLHKNGSLKTDFKTLSESISYHLPCHLKAQNIGFKSRDVLSLIPGVTVETVQQCSGHDGSWSMKKEYYEISLHVGKKLFDRIEKESSTTVSSDCMLAHLHISEGAHREAKHPIEIVHEAYDL